MVAGKYIIKGKEAERYFVLDILGEFDKRFRFNG